MKKYTGEIIFSIIGVICGIIAYFVILNSILVDKDVKETPIAITNTPTSLPTPTSIPTPTSVSTPEVIDYNSIPGVTEGQSYTDTLVADGSRNILIIGEDKVAGLYDTIGILSMDEEGKTAKIIMIPRDMYVNYNKKVVHYLETVGRSKDPSFYKINAAYNIGIKMKYEGKFTASSINFLADIVKEVFRIEINDYIKVNTEGFRQIVDLFGGVDIDVPYEMNYDDPFQGLSIHLKKGRQHLNGGQAEGFVRYRQGYDENKVFRSLGDLERKRNQIAFIKAFLNQKMTLGNITKLPGLIKTLNKNMKTSIDAGDVLVSYMGTLKDLALGKYKIESATITGKNSSINGSYSYIVGQIEGITN
ncbi:MAG TPA: LCP family protein [Pseudobacteroides sp.]|uniref:LCP family protein n=1 Tax=Pseudobacteroides sp. TaxID=1968840 RepID=UPI002F94BA20